MKKAKCCFVALAVAALAFSVTGGVEVATDRSDAMYKCGEKAVFTVKVTGADGALLTTGRVAAVVDNFGPKRQLVRTFDLAAGNPFTVGGALDEPGFLRLSLSGAGVKGTFVWSVGYEPDRIVPVTKVPADFDAFWANARAKLAKEVPLDPQVVKVAERCTGKFDFYRISFASFGRRVYGYMSVPKDASRAPYPVSLQVAAAGFGDWTNNMQGDPDRINVMFAVYPFEPHWNWRQLALKAKYDAMNAELSKKYACGGYAKSGFGKSREDSFFYPVILGIDRAIDWLARRPDVDAADISYQGTSQGGGMGLILTGLNKHIARAVFYVPAITDAIAGLGGRQSGWPQTIEGQLTAEGKATAARTMPYFDGASFATRITCPVRFAVGLADTTCAPHCTWAAFNATASADKRLFYGIGMGHGCRSEFYQALGVWAKGAKRVRPLAVTHTFDDNPKEHATVVRPLLDKYGWKGVFNVVAEGVGRGAGHLTWDDVRAMAAAGHEIADHSLSHPHFDAELKKGNTNEVRRQVVESKAIFARELGRAPAWFCYPFNWADDFTRKLVADSGMRSLACKRPNYGFRTAPRTDKGAYVQLLGALFRREPVVDLMVHGTVRGHGWEAFEDADQFERHLQEIKALEQEGFVKVLPYSAAHE